MHARASIIGSMNRMDTARRAQVVRCSSKDARSIDRPHDCVAKHTILKLLVELGEACAEYLDGAMRKLPCKRLQADETWSFCFAKQKNVKPHHFEDGGYAGDVWTWVAIDADTKLIPSWLLGQRDPIAARHFMEDLAGRLSSRVQLTTDGLKVYLNAVDRAFGNDIDYSMLIKIYSNNIEGQKRYSPAVCIGCKREAIVGNQTRTTLARRSLSARTSPCVCRCGGSPG